MEVRLGPRPPFIVTVPRAYIYWLPDDDNDGTKSTVGLDPLLPSLHDEQGKTDERLHFLLYKHPSRDLIEFREALKAESARFQFLESREGIDTYVKPQSASIPAAERATSGLQESLYLPQADKFASIICEEGSRPPQRCTFTFAIRDTLAADASIPRDEISHYAEIEARIRAYVQSIEK
jgi:hypothetical protein